MRNLVHERNMPAPVVNSRDIVKGRYPRSGRERIKHRLRQAEKMEAVGRVAGGIAHDLFNVFTIIFLNGEMLFEEVSGHSSLKRYAQHVLAAANRGRDLVAQILAFSRTQPNKRDPVDLASVVAEALELLQGSLPAAIRIEAGDLESPLVMIGDATQLHRVVMNLCTNAIQAMPGGGTLRVMLEQTEVTGERALSHGRLERGRYIRLIVEDNGSGMDESTRSRIFEPFFTTKDVGQGTGLGLSLVYAIVTDSGGGIDVTSALQRGSMFTVYLKHSEATLAAAQTCGAAPRSTL